MILRKNIDSTPLSLAILRTSWSEWLVESVMTLTGK